MIKCSISKLDMLLQYQRTLASPLSLNEHERTQKSATQLSTTDFARPKIINHYD